MPRLPGARLERGYRLVGFALVLFALVLGTGTASTVLAYDGTRPVNVFHFLAVFVGLQGVLLVAMLLMMGLRRASGTATLLGWVQSFIRWLSSARWVDRMLRDAPAGEMERRLGELRARHTLYGGVERWMLFGLSQRFGVAFNASALVTCLFLVAFTDLAFSWSTTLDLEGDELHGALQTVALPWSWAVGDAVPDPEVVAASRWVRHEGRGFVGEESLQAVKRWAGAWWRFLVMALLCWGLVPRLVALGFATWRERRALAAADLAHGSCQRLFERLLPEPAGWTAPDPGTVSEPHPAPRRARKPPRPAARPGAPNGRCGVVAWGRIARRKDTLPSVVGPRFGREVAVCCAAGGARIADDRTCVETLAREQADPVVLVVEAGVQPTKDIIGFLHDLRERLGARVQLVVGLAEEGPSGIADASEEERAQWEARLDSVGDPYLRLETMVAAR